MKNVGYKVSLTKTGSPTTTILLKTLLEVSIFLGIRYNTVRGKLGRAKKIENISYLSVGESKVTIEKLEGSFRTSISITPLGEVSHTYSQDLNN